MLTTPSPQAPTTRAPTTQAPIAQAPITVTPPSRYAEAWDRRLAAGPARSARDVLQVAPGDVLLVVVAHPDDETLAMGAALAQLAAEGVEVHVVSMTRGEAALDHVGVPAPGLAARRTAELHAAAAALGLAGATALDLPDSRLADHDDDLEVAVAGTCRRLQATRVATLWHDDPHPDHRAVSRAARRVARRVTAVAPVEMALWTTHWTDPADVASTCVRVETGAAASAARRAALACYRSQTEPLAEGLSAVLPSAVVAWPHEYQVRT